jgi:hypothetical protein
MQSTLLAPGLILPHRRQFYNPRRELLVPTLSLGGGGHAGHHTASVDKTITNLGAVRATSAAHVALGYTANSGDIIFVQCQRDANSVPTTPDGTWTTLASGSDAAGWGYLTCYKVLTGSITDSGTFGNTDYIGAMCYRNAGGAWVVGTANNYAAVSTTGTYTSCSPDGTTQWGVSMAHASGGFSYTALAAGTNVTQRIRVTTGSFRVSWYDSNGFASTWPGQSDSPGFCGYHCCSFTLAAA